MKHLEIKAVTILIFLIFVSCTNHYEEGKKLFDNNDYEKSKAEFNQVSKGDDKYSHAQLLIIQADSIIEVNSNIQFIKDSIASVKRKRIIDSVEVIQQIRKDSIAIIEKKLAVEKKIEKLQEELKSIRTFNGSDYRGDVSSLNIEVALFSVWGKMAKEAKSNENLKISTLGKSMEQNLKTLQVREFPRIRENYAKIVKDKLWEENIKVQCFGSRKTTLQFTGGMFASNKNKKDFQTTLSEIFRDFRFNRINYKWYEYDDEYTYYTIDSDNDSEIITY